MGSGNRAGEAKIWIGVSPGKHSEEVLAALASMKN
jgi:hypothetical protein